MKKISFILFIIGNLSSAQVGVGTSTFHEGVVFQIESANKGLLIPRVALTSKVSTSPLPATIPTSTIVFNTATAGTFPNLIKPGWHWWSAEDAQWTDFDYDLNAASLKYTNSETTTNYNTTTLQNVKLFGNKIINESGAIYSVNTTNHTATVKKAGLYAISAILAFDRAEGGSDSRLSLSTRVYVNNTAVGTEHVISPDVTLGVGGGRGLFSHSFVEHLVLAANDIISVRIVKTTGTYSSGWGVSAVDFQQSGESIITIVRIR